MPSVYKYVNKGNNKGSKEASTTAHGRRAGGSPNKKLDIYFLFLLLPTRQPQGRTVQGLVSTHLAQIYSQPTWPAPDDTKKLGGLARLRISYAMNRELRAVSCKMRIGTHNRPLLLQRSS